MPSGGDNPLLRAALGYLARGFSVVPLHNIEDGHCTCRRGPECKSPGKHVRLTSWAKYQRDRATESEVREWWRRWPQANVGVIMGRVSGVFAIDCDSPDKEAYVVGVCGGVPDTETHYAKRGPHFCWFYPADGGDVPSCLIGPRVEVISDGKLVVAPPSMHQTGIRYETNGEPLTEAPSTLLKIIREEGITEGGQRIDPDELKKMLGGVPKGERHPTLIRLIGRWVEKGLTLEEVEQQALGWNSRLKDPEPAENVLIRARDGYRRWHEEVEADAEETGVERDADGVVVSWPQGVEIAFRKIRVGTDECEVYISHQGKPREWRRFNVASGSQRDDLRRLLEKYPDLKSINWTAVLNRSCQIVHEEYRHSGPIKALKPSLAPVCRNLFEPFVVRYGTVAVLYGDGGTAKSTLLLMLMLAYVIGRPLPGLEVFTPKERGTALYLDWESDEDDHEDRLASMLEAFDIDPSEVEGRIFYRRMEAPLAEDADNLRSEIARTGVGLVGVDSYVMAAGVEAEGSEAARRVMEALRSFPNTTSIVITHVPGADARDEKRSSRPYGSVFVRNLPRSVWEVRLQDQMPEGLDSIRVLLHHRKVNRGQIAKEFAVTISYEDGRITGAQQGWGKPEDTGLRLDRRVRLLLPTENGLTVKQVADFCEVSEGAANRALNRLEKHGLAERRDGGPLRGNNVVGVWFATSAHEEPADTPQAEEVAADV